MIKCSICLKELVSIKALSQHIRFHNVSSQQYYDEYISKSIDKQKCVYCGKETKFRYLSLGYQKYCGSICSNNDEERKKKFRDSYLKNDFQKVKEKRGKTNLEKYGNENANASLEIKEKSRINFLANQIPRRIKEFDVWDLDILSDYKIISRQTLATFKCKRCGKIFEETIFNIWQRTYKCTCRIPRTGSINENELKFFIKELLPEEEILYNQKIDKYEADIAIPKHRIAFEYNGLYWHSEKILKDPINYHKDKKEAFQKCGYRLIQVFEDEWVDKNEIVKDRIRHILKIRCTERLFARNCIIKQIEYKVKEKFLSEYHLQGNDVSNINLGAFHQNILIAVMTFSKGSISKGATIKIGNWELSRFCIKKGIDCVGIAGKLLSFFKKNYSWNYIYSYADKRWSDGNLYYLIGFSLERTTAPNYWYTKNGMKRIHRFNLRKRDIDSKEISEWVLREREGFYRIWDCGNLKFSMINRRI